MKRQNRFSLRKINQNSLPKFAGKVAVLCLMLALAVPASASSFVIKTESTPSAAHLELSFTEDTHCTGNTIEKRELLLQCDRAIEPPSTGDLITELNSWIAWISNGYDTLLIHAARDSSFTVSSTGPRQIAIRLTPVETARTAEDSNTLLPAILNSRLLAATGKPRSAENMLRQSLIAHPDNGQLLLELAELELRAKRWRYASDLYSKALLDQPRNEDLMTFRRKILREHGPSVSYESNARTLQADHSEFVTSTSADWGLSLPTKLGFRIDQNHFRSLEPWQQNKQTYIRNRIEASLQHDFLNGSIVNAAMVSNGPETGARVSYGRPDLYGVTHIETGYGIPFWDLLSSLQGNGVRDRITAGRMQQISRRITAQLDASLNRYRMANAVLLRTYGASAGINYAIRRQYPAIELEYLVDIEKHAGHPPSAGFPLSNRNVHAMGSAVSTPIGRKAELLASGGMSFDIDGGQGPFIATRFKQHFTDRLSAEVWTERRHNSILTGRVVTSVGIKIVFALGGKERP